METALTVGNDTDLNHSESELQHPTCTLDPDVKISKQFSSLCKALGTCRTDKLDGVKECIMAISDPTDDSGKWKSNPIDEITNISSVEDAFDVLASSVDIELLESVLNKFPCGTCSNYLSKYKENMRKSSYSEHSESIPKLKAGMKCVACVFREVDNISDPPCEVIIEKKQFCSVFNINPGALRLIDCSSKQEDSSVILKWQIFPHIVESDVFHDELNDDSLHKVTALKLKSLRVEKTALYFYRIKDIDVTEPLQPVSCSFSSFITKNTL